MSAAATPVRTDAADRRGEAGRGGWRVGERREEAAAGLSDGSDVHRIIIAI